MSELLDIAGAAWSFRAGVEHDAAARFERLAPAVAAVDAHSPVVERLALAAEDERRHLALCVDLTRRFGGRMPSKWEEAPPIAPSGLSRREAVLYELTAACCVAETQSMATLTTLLQVVSATPAPSESLLPVLRAITRDEVRHAQLGWAHLARERRSMDVGFLSALLPRMLAGTGDEALFRRAATPELEDERLFHLGVLPHSKKRDVFLRTLDEIVLPGFSLLGVDDGPGRQWLAAKRATPD